MRVKALKLQCHNHSKPLALGVLATACICLINSILPTNSYLIEFAMNLAQVCFVVLVLPPVFATVADKKISEDEL